MKNMKYGIEITKPWSKEMYDHNDKVAELMKAEILLSIKNNKNNWDKLNELIQLCGGIQWGASYGSDDDTSELYEEVINQLDNVQNYWLNEEYPYYVEKGLVSDIDLEFIGY